jgi:hypothetical protein
MTLTTRKLKRIVAQELNGLIRENKKNWKVVKKKMKKKKSDRERKDEVFPGHDEMTQVAHGITEDELSEFNKQHGSDGLFATDADSTSESSYFDDGHRKRKSGGLSQPKSQYGRGKHKHKGKGKRKLKDDTVAEKKDWQQLFKEFYSAYNVDAPEETEVYDEDEESKIAFDRITGEAIEVDHGEPDEMYDCAKQRQADQMIIKKLKAGIEQMKKSGQKQCGLSYDDAVRIVNTMELASKGKAFGDSG